MTPTHVTLVPHTHWDREWYEPFDVFLERLVTMMDTLLSLADRGFPHFHLDGQTAMIDDYLAVRPERAEDVRRHVTDGRLSAGPWVTQMDEFLTSGESHIRNLEMGLARARELGAAMEIGYLPDQFGHVGQMPQILRQAGIGRAVVWRGVPHSIDRTAFRWEAPDGSWVLTEYLEFGYFLGGDVPRFRAADELAQALRDKLERIAPFVPGDRVPIMVGADHSGPDADLPERLAASERLLDGTTVRIGSLADHLAAPSRRDLPVWRGELRSSARAHLLPNVYSARAHQKRERGRVESLVERYAEPLAALVSGFEWPGERLHRVWTLLLWNGAHDSVCGCSHDQVALDVDARYTEAREIADAIVEEALAALGVQAPAGVLRFNPSPFERDGVPGLGWRVDPQPVDAAAEPIELRIGRDGWLHVDGALSFTLLDEPDVGDLYNFCHAEEGQVPARPTWTVLSPGAIEARWDELGVRMHVSRALGESFYRLEGTIMNGRPDHRVRLCVRLQSAASGSLAGSPFELVRRPLASEGGDVEAPSPTWPARHVVLAGGVAAYHEGVFEYETTRDELFVTLLRCVGTISRGRLATRPWPAGPDIATPRAQMIGPTTFAIGLRPSANEDTILVDWERFALPIRETHADGGGMGSAFGSMLEIDGEAILSSVCRDSDGGVRVRMWNPKIDEPVVASVAGRAVDLAPAAIRAITIGTLGEPG